jgi:hypothetical protein
MQITCDGCGNMIDEISYRLGRVKIWIDDSWLLRYSFIIKRICTSIK